MSKHRKDFIYGFVAVLVAVAELIIFHFLF